MRANYALVRRLGRGTVYLGSSRARDGHAHYAEARDLARRLGATLGSTAWSGAGPGLMEAISLGAREGGVEAAGFKIMAEATQVAETWEHPFLPRECYLVNEFFSARKHGLVDAGVRQAEAERCAFVCLPGGVGTLDELFEVLALAQLGRLRKASPLPQPPCVVMNYGKVFDPIADFISRAAPAHGYVAEGEMDPHVEFCSTNDEAVALLADFYGVEAAK